MNRFGVVPTILQSAHLKDGGNSGPKLAYVYKLQATSTAFSA